MITLGNNYIKKTADEFYKKDNINDYKNMFDNADMILITKLNNLKSSLCCDNINLKNIKQQINDISAFDKNQNYEYLSNLLRPEKARGSKIPSQVPVPSCAFQLHNCVTISTNSTGMVAMILNPCFLASENILGYSFTPNGSEIPFSVRNFVTSMWVNNDDSLNGTTANDKWNPINIGQTIPPVYDQYRLVSASLVVRYIGRLDAAQGMIGGAIIFDEANTIGGQVMNSQTQIIENTVSEELNKYGNFDLAMDSFYHQENMSLEGVRELYFPIDNSYEEYNKIYDNTVVTGDAVDVNVNLNTVENYYRSGFNWFFYSLNAPPSQPCFKVDIYCNFECLPVAKFLNYLPISLNLYSINPEDKKKMILTVQNKPIWKVEEDSCQGLVPSLFAKMIKKFDNGLPCFDKLKSWGLINAVPGLNSGLALAGNMIASNMIIDNCGC